MKPDPAALLEALAELVAERVAVRLASKASPEPILVPVHEGLSITRRNAAELCRAAKIKGACLLSRRWMAPPASLRAYVASLAEEPTLGADDGDAGIRKLAREMGLEVSR